MSAALLTTRQVAALLNVSPTSVKRWADEGVLEHVRTHGEHRRFRAEVIERFRRALEQAPEQSSVSPAEVQTAAWLDTLAADPSPQRVAAELLELRARLGSYHRAADAFGATLSALGELWAKAELTVLEEHAISAAIERGLTLVREQLVVPASGPRCLLAMVEGDDHALGLNFAELVLKENGYRTFWAGRATPLEVLLGAIESEQFNLVAVSASPWSTDKKKLAELARRLGKSAAEYGVPVILGGSGAWPDEVEGATRIKTFAALADKLTRM